MKIIDVIGKKFGKFTVIEKVPATTRSKVKYKVRCDCGKVLIREIGDIYKNVGGCRVCGSKGKRKNFKPTSKRNQVAHMTVEQIRKLPWPWHIRNYYITLKKTA